MTYVSMVYAITRRLQPTSTLFPYTTLFRSDGYLLRADGSREMLQSRHLPLGILPPERFAAPMEEYPVQPGDHVLLMTDGVLEAEDGQGQQFGVQRLAAVLDNPLPSLSPVDHVIQAVQSFTGDALE